jgi:peroxiredoxin Q/BCP
MLYPAPDFLLADQNGEEKKLSDYAGKWLVVYFYPKDSTPGCTTEACKFRDERDAIAEFGKAEIIGISKDSVESHKHFTEKHNLNFTLLSDPDHKTIEAYKSWGLRKFLGKDYYGTFRNTFIVNPSGDIVKEYLGVDPQKHAGEIIKDLKYLQAN